FCAEPAERRAAISGRTTEGALHRRVTPTRRHVFGTVACTASQPPRRGSVCCANTTQALPPRQSSLTDLPDLRSSSHDEEAQDVATRLTWLARAGWLLEQPPFWGS